MHEWLSRLWDWVRRGRLDRELADELRFHREQLEREAHARGLDPTEAAHLARRQLGNVTRHREDARERWSWPWLDQFLQDVRYALRGLRRSPGFTITVVLTLGLGIGANAAMFGVIDRLMFRPLPYLRDPGRVHRVYLQWNDRWETRTLSGGFEYTTYLDLRKQSTAFSQMAAFTAGPIAIGTGEDTRERRVAMVSAAFFEFFDARPALGRFFVTAEDTTPRGAPVAVLGYDFWKTEFGGRNVIGETLQVHNIPSTIVGVAPEGFAGVTDDQPPAVFIPITTYAGYAEAQSDPTNYYTRYNWGWVSTMVRRKPGVSEAAASTDLSHAYLRSWNAARAIDPETTPAEIARPRAIAGPLRVAAGPDADLEAKTLRWVMAVAVIVLLIACANVANLMFARVLARRREIAVRLALGVSRRRLVGQYLTESLVLAGSGCVAGLLIAQWGGAALRHLFVQPGSGLDVLTDPRSLATAVGFALAAGMLTGIGPAILAGRDTVADTLKAGARAGTYHRSRARTALLVFQGALSVMLLIGAGLFVRSLRHVRAMRLGYDADPVLVARQVFRGIRLDDSARTALGHRLLETAQAIPGVERATLVSSIPFLGTSTTDLFVPGIDSVGRLGRFTYQVASPDYFQTMGTRILRGRPFGPEDRSGTPRVMVVSEGMARTLWPGQEALGQCVRVRADTMPCTTVIGIAEDAVQNSLTDDLRLRYYMPIEQAGPPRGLLLRMRGEPAAQAEVVRRTLQPVMPGEAYVNVLPLSEVIDEQRRSWKVGATMFVAFGGLALLVAAVGLYGVMSYNVAQRTHELGVRIALGARTPDVVRLVVGQGVRFGLAGTVIGVLLALLAARWIQPLLFEQSARDPAIYGGVGFLLLLVAVAGSALPALRATRADPNTALRSE